MLAGAAEDGAFHFPDNLVVTIGGFLPHVTLLDTRRSHKRFNDLMEDAATVNAATSDISSAVRYGADGEGLEIDFGDLFDDAAELLAYFDGLRHNTSGLLCKGKLGHGWKKDDQLRVATTIVSKAGATLRAFDWEGFTMDLSAYEALLQGCTGLQRLAMTITAPDPGGAQPGAPPFKQMIRCPLPPLGGLSFAPAHPHRSSPDECRAGYAAAGSSSTSA